MHSLARSLHKIFGKSLMQLFDDVYFMGQSFATIFLIVYVFCFVFIVTPSHVSEMCEFLDLLILISVKYEPKFMPIYGNEIIKPVILSNI